jgi:triosephosphate isomerase
MSKKKTQKLVVANWKMNPQTLKEAKKNFNDFKKQKTVNKNVTTVICPPFQYLYELKKSYRGSKIFFGAQDVSIQKEGSFTGEISNSMIKDMGARFVIAGHSERREMGESSELVAEKALNSLQFGFHVIVCVGEKERDFEGMYLKDLAKQIKDSLEGIPTKLAEKLIIAYEPIWAIGEGKKAMDAKEMHFISLFIRKQLIKIFNKKTAQSVGILYGGSVNSDNAKDFVIEEDVDGLLVGRASLNPFEFSKIVTNVSNSI